MSALQETGERRLAKPLSAKDEATWLLVRKWADENVASLTDMLSKMVTLNTAMIGGGVVVIRGDTLPVWSGVFCLIFLLASLLAAMSGLWPKSKAVDMGDMDSVRTYAKDLESNKANTLLASGLALSAAALVAVVGAVVKLVCP